jgi:type VI secretion system Hcp family effector
MNCYLTIVGARQGKFKGESAVPGHEDAIEGISLDYTVGLPIDAATGQPTGKVEHRPFRFIKASGPATPQILAAFVGKEQIKTVTIQFVKTTSDTIAIESIVITNGLIVEFRHHLGTSTEANVAGRPFDEIALTYQKIDMRYPAAATSATDTWVTPT